MHKILILAVASALFATACASTGAKPRPFPSPTVHSGPVESSPRAEPVESSPRIETVTKPTVDAYELVGAALKFRGVPYKNGGTDPTGFDCSGFTQYVFAQYGLALPRDVRTQFTTGTAIDRNHILPGDLVFFTTTDPGASHVGIAVGGGEFVHAPSTSGVVRVENIESTYWARRFVGSRRLIGEEPQSRAKPREPGASRP